jgi:hypothetical protein
MPAAEDLPRSIAALSSAQAVTLPWHDGVREIAGVVSAEARRLADEIRVPLGNTSTANAAVRAMEASLFNQRLGRIRLDAAELSATLDRLTDFERVGNSFLMPDLIYAIDVIGVGVKASRGDRRYVARSKQIKSLDHLVQVLREHHIVLAGMALSAKGWNDPEATRGVLDYKRSDGLAGGVLSIVTGWDARRRVFEIHTFHRPLGNQGLVMLAYGAARHVLGLDEMRLIEAAEMPMPISQKARRDLESRLPKATRQASRKAGRT